MRRAAPVQRLVEFNLRQLQVVLALVVVLWGGPAVAQKACNCLPGTVPAYGSGKGAPDENAFGEQLAAAPSLDLGEAAPAQLGGSFAFTAPNFVGDFIAAASGGGTQIIGQAGIGGTLSDFLPSGSSAPYVANDPLSTTATIDPLPGGPFGGPSTVVAIPGGATFTTAISSAQMLAALQANPNALIPITDNVTYRALVNNYFIAQHGNVGTTVFRPSINFFNTLTNSPDTATSSAVVTSPAVSPGSPTGFNYGYFYDYVVELNLPSPGTGGVVGVQKLVENSSPIPRDRILFNYSWFQNVRFTPGGLDVNRFVAGSEKTFFNQSCSLEFRAPFASTLSADQVSGQTAAQNTQFGNLTLYAKGLMAYGPSYAIGAGLGFGLPTAKDINVRDINATPLVQIQNQSLQLLPYLGGVYAPNDRFFSQAILQFDVVTNGNPALVNNGAALVQAGKLNDPTWLFASFNAGYWTYRTSPSERLSGIAPLLELHYNSTLNNTDVVNAGAFRLGNRVGTLEMINMVAGANLEFFGRSYVSIAYVAPLTGGADRFFDGELRVLCNRFYW